LVNRHARALRRRIVQALGTASLFPCGWLSATAAPPDAQRFAPVVPEYRMRFPDDEGSHPEFRLEWWYVTGWLKQATRELGFQITFFRARPDRGNDNPSAFMPRQIIIAHAAVSDPDYGRLIHAQRAARAGFDLAGAAEGHTRVWLDRWSLSQQGGIYRARLSWDEAAFDFSFTARDPPLLQGEAGYSRKGPVPLSASYYYSIPHLAVQGSLRHRGRIDRVMGVAWLDHEWSSQYLDEHAVGWDWVGINLDDGGAIMLFRMRDRDGGPFWAGGTLRAARGQSRTLGPQEIHFTALREWRSTRTGVRYPVAWRVETPVLGFSLEPLMDDQEHDTRATSGTLYWEGAVRALHRGEVIGRGYLELTGYAGRVDLSDIESRERLLA
jgi:predicted secreted hydrolase